MEDRPPDSPEPSVPPSYVYDAPSEPPPPQPVIPWEEPGRPWLSGMVETIKLLFTSPRVAFERVPVDTSLLRPYLFGWVVGLVGLYAEVAGLFLQMAISPNMIPSGGPPEMEVMMKTIMPMFFLIFPPFSIALGIPIIAVLTHASLLVTGGAQFGIRRTLRAVSYSYGGAILFVVPFCGGLLGAAAQMVFLAIGLSALHRISLARAIIAMFLPFACFIVCFLFAFFSFMSRMSP